MLAGAVYLLSHVTAPSIEKAEYFFFCIWVFCLHVRLCTMSMNCTQRPEEVIGSRVTRQTESWGPSCGSCEPNACLLQEPQLLSHLSIPSSPSCLRMADYIVLIHSCPPPIVDVGFLHPLAVLRNTAVNRCTSIVSPPFGVSAYKLFFLHVCICIIFL